MRKYGGLIVLLFAVDQLSKLWAQGFLAYGESHAVFPGFSWALTYNTGIAFGVGADESGWIRAFLMGTIITVIVMLIHFLRKTPASETIPRLGLSLIISGALGNLWDRIYLGHVIDFIDIYYKSYHWPAFNVADAAICIGAVLLMLRARNRN